MSVAFSADIEFEDLYRGHYQPAQHPGDEHRQTRVSYLGEISKLNHVFWFRQWLEKYNQPARDVPVAELYETYRWWREHCDQPPRKVQLADVLEAGDDLIIFGMNLIVERGRSRGTANKFRRTINPIWNWAAKKLKTRRPDNERYRENVDAPIAFLPEELDQIFSACNRRSGYVGNVRADRWWRMCVSFIHATALRIGAARNVPTKKLELSRGGIRVPSGTQKNRREKWLDLFPSTIEAIRACRIEERGVQFVLGDWPHNTNTLRRHFAGILVDAGLFPSIDAVPRELKFHALRKTLASQIYAKTGLKAIAQERLDHCSVEVTERYLDPRYETDHRLMDIAEDPLKPKPSGNSPRPVLRIADCG